MFTILLNDDNTLTISVKERIMERSSLVDKLCFLVPKTYNDFDMTEFACTLEYVLPVSKKYKSEMLSAESELYENEYIQFILPFDTKLTSEPGDIELQLSLVKADLTDEGEQITYVRKSSTVTITIVPIAAWSDFIPDDALNAVDQKIAELQALIAYLRSIQDGYINKIPDDLALTDDLLQLTVSGNKIGNGVNILIPTEVEGGVDNNGIIEI